jgi:phenylalanyl-tRNA synthetase beta subunit
MIYQLVLLELLKMKNIYIPKSTTSLLIEGSIFNAAKIRQQSRNLGLRTDRSARYEKSLKQTYLLESLYRLISLLRVKNPNITCKLCRFLQEKEESLKILKLNYSTIQEILGPIHELTTNESKFIPPKKVSDYLQRLNFEFLYQDSELSMGSSNTSFTQVMILHEKLILLKKLVDYMV